MQISQYISGIVLLFALALYFMKGPAILFLHRVTVGIFTFFSIFLILFFYTANHFSGRGISMAVIYYMHFGFEGMDLSEYKTLIIFIFGLLIAILFFCIWIITRKSKKLDYSQKYIVPVSILLILSIIFNPVTISLGNYYRIYAMESVPDETSDFFNYYSKPNIIAKGHSKNLVYIYAESLEKSYFDEGVFPGLMKNLKLFKDESISFTNIRQDEVSNHTIGGIVATQCGFPLISYSYTNTMNGMDYFLGLTDCLGDLLYKNGYSLSFFGGANLNFSGKGMFFKTHKFQSVKGLTELLPYVEDGEYRNSWGLYDDTVLAQAFESFKTLAGKNSPFALFVLTLDTHHPNGFISKSCENIKYLDGENPILNAVACSDYLISDFILKIRNSGLDDNTVIVISSDHLAFQNSAIDILNNVERRNLFLVNLPKSKSPMEIDTPGLTLDLGTTILPFIGFSGEIGFGRDLSKITNPSKRVDELLKKLPDFYPFIMSFWDFPSLKESILVNTVDEKINIDMREFSLPILIAFDEDLKTKLFFRNDMPKDFSLKEFLNDTSIKNYLLIESVNSDDKYFLSTGKDNFSSVEIKGVETFTVEEIREMVGL